MLHGVGFWRMFVANGLAMLVSSLVCDVLPLPTLHLAMRVWENGHWIIPAFDLRSGF